MLATVGADTGHRRSQALVSSLLYSVDWFLLSPTLPLQELLLPGKCQLFREYRLHQVTLQLASLPRYVAPKGLISALLSLVVSFTLCRWQCLPIRPSDLISICCLPTTINSNSTNNVCSVDLGCSPFVRLFATV